MSTILDRTPVVPTTLHLPEGIPGFPGLRDLQTSPWGGDHSPFVVLACDEPDVRFVATGPATFFPEYQPEVPADLRADLGLGEEPGLLLVILTLGTGPHDTTANLLGPLVVNPVTGQARQVVLSGSPWSPRTPIAPA